MNDLAVKNAIAALLKVVRDNLQDSSFGVKGRKNAAIIGYIRTQPLFGNKGDRLLHILIQNDNPHSINSYKTSLWSDAPKELSNTNASNVPSTCKGGASVPGAAGGSTTGHGPIAPKKNFAPPGSAKQKENGNMIAKNPELARTHLDPMGADSSVDGRGLGRLILLHLLSNAQMQKFFTQKPEAPSGQNEITTVLPLYLAVEKENFAFLACFLSIYHDPQHKGLRRLMDTIIETKSRLGDGNVIHAAIRKGNPLTSCFVAVCSEKALLEEDTSKHTPLHLAINQDIKRHPWIPPRPAVLGEQAKYPPWERIFEPEKIFAAIEGRCDHQRILQISLKSVNNAGNSPLQDRLALPKVDLALAKRIKDAIFNQVQSISDVSTALYGTAGATKELYLNMADFNQASHNFHGFVDKLTQSSSPSQHRFAQYPAADIDSMGALQPEAVAAPARAPAHFENQSVIFEDILFFVHLPDLNYIKQPCPQSAIRKLFQWLKACGVHTIRRLRIPDSTLNPLPEAFVQKYILDEFLIEWLDWRKLDINIDVMLRSFKAVSGAGQGEALDIKPGASVLKKLTLYSSGNWSTLYHWSSKDGLVLFPNLHEVQINVVQLNQTEDYHDTETHKRHLNLSKVYASRLEEIFTALSKDTGREHIGKWETKVDMVWDYPLPTHEPDDPTSQVLTHQFTAQLQPSIEALQQLADSQSSSDHHSSGDHTDDDDDDNDGYETSDSSDDDGDAYGRKPRGFRRRLLPFIRVPQKPRQVDRRIRVAIIDNGADRVRSLFRGQIAKGESFVFVNDVHSNDQPLPWWMVSDAHGTQMASLVSQTNPYCRLYIVRVGTLRSDIQPDSAAKAIEWALKHNVDIISMSWTLNYDDPTLRTAIEKAAEQRVLLFASMPDQGVYSEAWPANYTDHAISVSATDQYGHLSSKARTARQADVRIPGENVRAAGPAYIGNTSMQVSGSSVATALAAGLASLALMLLRTFNKDLPVDWPGSNTELSEEKKHNRHFYYTKKGMLRFFAQMETNADEAILLKHMFPYEAMHKVNVIDKLSRNWNVKGWKKSQSEKK